jgi:hypothetical protein
MKKRPSRGATFGSYFAMWFLLNPAKAADFKAYLAATYEGSHGLLARHTGGEWRLAVEEMEAARNAMGLDELGRYNIQVCPHYFFRKHRTHHMQANKLLQLMLTNSPGGRPFKYQAQCPQVFKSCLELASPTRGRNLADFIAAPPHTHLASKQGERVNIIILRHLFV